ncbi:MAG: metallophosphoesterase [Polaromonas sp.]
MSLIQTLPAGPLDIVGDIHGEYDALCDLLRNLGYDDSGLHPDGRTLVFVGDFCDRGPDSPAVLALAERLVRSGRAVAVLGNHEINLIREDAKDGSGWFFDARLEKDQPKYHPYKRPDEQARSDIVGFLSTLPVALERPDLRVVHAAWVPEKIEAARALDRANVRRHYDSLEGEANRHARKSGLQHRMDDEAIEWGYGLEDPQKQPPFLHAHAEHDANKQMMNPLKVLTSGVERKGRTPFFSGGKWRFAERVAWWDEYSDAVPVVVGHYWRRVHEIDRMTVGKGDADLFAGVSPYAWHGKLGNVFCVDFSVGGRWTERKDGKKVHGKNFRLAALRWPENTLQFDDGESVRCEGSPAP